MPVFNASLRRSANRDPSRSGRLKRAPSVVTRGLGAFRQCMQVRGSYKSTAAGLLLYSGSYKVVSGFDYGVQGESVENKWAITASVPMNRAAACVAGIGSNRCGALRIYLFWYTWCSVLLA